MACSFGIERLLTVFRAASCGSAYKLFHKDSSERNFQNMLKRISNCTLFYHACFLMTVHDPLIENPYGNCFPGMRRLNGVCP